MATPASYNTPPKNSVTQSVLDTNNNARAVARMANPYSTPTTVQNARMNIDLTPEQSKSLGAYNPATQPNGTPSRVTYDPQAGGFMYESIQGHGNAVSSLTADQIKQVAQLTGRNDILDIPIKSQAVDAATRRSAEEKVRAQVNQMISSNQLAQNADVINKEFYKLLDQELAGKTTWQTALGNVVQNYDPYSLAANTLPTATQYDKAHGITSPIINDAYIAGATRNPTTGAVTPTNPTLTATNNLATGTPTLQELAAKRAQAQAGWGITGYDANGLPIIGGKSTNTPTTTGTANTSMNTGATGTTGTAGTAGAPGTGSYTADQQAILNLLKPSQEEQDVQAKIDALLSQTAAGKANAATQAIPMNFITGQQAQIEARSLANTDPLTRQLARLQAARTAESGVQEKKYEYDTANAKIAADKQAAADKAAAETLKTNTENVGKFQKFVSDFLKDYNLSPSAATAQVINDLAPLVQSGKLTPEAAYLQYQIAAGTNPKVAAQNLAATTKASKTSGSGSSNTDLSNVLKNAANAKKIQDGFDGGTISPEAYVVEMNDLGVPLDTIKQSLSNSGYSYNDGNITKNKGWFGF